VTVKASQPPSRLIQSQQSAWAASAIPVRRDSSSPVHFSPGSITMYSALADWRRMRMALEIIRASLSVSRASGCRVTARRSLRGASRDSAPACIAAMARRRMRPRILGAFFLIARGLPCTHV
jgi:hypothetical protein